MSANEKWITDMRVEYDRFKAERDEWRATSYRHWNDLLDARAEGEVLQSKVTAWRIAAVVLFVIAGASVAALTFVLSVTGIV